MGAVQVRGEVLSTRRTGEYHTLTIVAPGIADGARPGQFVALAVGGDHSAMLLRRAFSIYRVQERGIYGGTVEIVFSVHGKGTAWLASLHAHDPVDVVGPLGRPFALPREPVTVTLVGGGYGSAPLFTLAEQLRGRGCRVDFVIGAATEGRLFGALEAKRISTQVSITTEDGSLGEKGRVTDVLPSMLERSGAEPYPPPTRVAVTCSFGSANARPSGPTMSTGSCARSPASQAVPGPWTEKTISTVPP